MVEDFDAMEVCCETVMACVEPDVCDCLFSGFIFVVFPCSVNVLLDEATTSWENFSCVFCFISLLTVSKLGDVCVSLELKCIFLLISDLILTNIFVCSVVFVVHSPAEGTSCM
jgi:hypothetical protein